MGFIIARKEYPFHPLNNPSEHQGEGTSAKFVFLVICFIDTEIFLLRSFTNKIMEWSLCKVVAKK